MDDHLFVKKLRRSADYQDDPRDSRLMRDAANRIEQLSTDAENWSISAEAALREADKLHRFIDYTREAIEQLGPDAEMKGIHILENLGGDRAQDGWVNEHAEVDRLRADLAAWENAEPLSPDPERVQLRYLVKENERLRATIEQAVEELDAEHWPEWYNNEAERAGKEPVGCGMCWPKDGSWPCSSRMVADDIRKAL